MQSVNRKMENGTDLHVTAPKEDIEDCTIRNSEVWSARLLESLRFTHRKKYPKIFEFIFQNSYI